MDIVFEQCVLTVKLKAISMFFFLSNHRKLGKGPRASEEQPDTDGPERWAGGLRQEIGDGGSDQGSREAVLGFRQSGFGH